MTFGHNTFSSPLLAGINAVLQSMSEKERKAMITLSRSQSLPSSHDTILRSRTEPILPHIFVGYDSLSDIDSLPLTRFGEDILPIITSPLTAGMLIVLCLELPIDYDTESIRLASWNKEMAATQTMRSEGKWNWDVLFGNEEYIPGSTIIHPDFPVMSPLQKRFKSSLQSFRRKYQGKRIFPHYTTRGVSHETGDWIRNRVLGSKVVKHGRRQTFFRDIDFSNIRSKDVIQYYIRQGVFPAGRVEMRQQWSPNLLVPRTYFAWGGDAIAASCYLRTLFNDLADIFPCTHRFNRVQPDWLKLPRDRPVGASFYFYDLTSFTSWFHEHVPLLRAIARSLEGVNVDLVGEGLTIKEASVSALINNYIVQVNDFPEFYFRRSPTLEVLDASRRLRHWCAGFLGVPGNLVTCTLGHGLAQASLQNSQEYLQVPGDDVGALTVSNAHRWDIITNAKSLGYLQTEKVYDSRQSAVYLKRGVRLTADGVTLTKMVIYPISSMYIPPGNDHEYRRLSGIYRMPDRKQLIKRGAQILVTFYRDLWNISHGRLEEYQIEVISSFLQYLHRRMGLPECGVLQGQLLGDSDVDESCYGSISVKFPLDDDFLRKDPDILFSSRYIEQLYVRDVSGIDVTWDIHGGLRCGQILTARLGRKWSFLRDMGYIEEVQRVGGEKILLIGDEAKEAFLRSRKPPFGCFRVVEDISPSQLAAVGFSAHSIMFDSAVFDESSNPSRRVDPEYRHPLKYRDWDRPTFGGIEYDYGNDGVPNTMMQFGNDSMDLLDLY